MRRGKKGGRSEEEREENEIFRGGDNYREGKIGKDIGKSDMMRKANRRPIFIE